MTKIAIVGAGILGRSILHLLSKVTHNNFTLFLIDHELFAKPCSTHSTAVASTRGTTKGHSPLGDLIVDGFLEFKNHVKSDCPRGVSEVRQLNASSEKKENFFKRFPESKELNAFGGISFSNTYFAQDEEAFVIHPEHYLQWLFEESKKTMDLQELKDFIVDYSSTDSGVLLKTQSGEILEVDQLIFAGGVHNRFWEFKNDFSGLAKSRSIQGTYLHFSGFEGIEASLSLTMDGNNLVYRKETSDLLLGASSEESHLHLPNSKELEEIYEYFKSYTNIPLPAFKEGRILTGLREKFTKRSPYFIQSGRVSFVGGMYKNGFSLSYLMAKKVVQSFLNCPT